MKPNIVLIYLDDLGYGDVSAYQSGTLQTPNMDRLANEGLRFTDGYASSATCTPSRYAIMTGTYPWRNPRASILRGDSAMIIDTEETTLPGVLGRQGYHTALVGKWHLGLGSGSLDWNEEISPGPNQVGFDYSYIMAATQDRVPTVYIENGRVVNLDPNDPIEVDYRNNFEGEPTALTHPELVTMPGARSHSDSIVNGIPRIGFMRGGASARWSDIDMADHFLEKGIDYIQERSQSERPFFLFFSMQQPHVPRTPNPRFVGETGMGPRGDVIAEADWVVGELYKTLEKEGLLENTLIVLTSDNGPVLNDGYQDDARAKLGDHTPSGGFRGQKYHLFEAGTRVPFVTYWKGTIQPGVSSALVTQIDLLASLAALTGSDASAPDSENLLDAFLGKSQQGRDSFVSEARRKTALRAGDWVMIPPYPGDNRAWYEVHQLFNLKDDPGQENNLAESHPEKLQEMVRQYTALRKGASEK